MDLGMKCLEHRTDSQGEFGYFLSVLSVLKAKEGKAWERMTEIDKIAFGLISFNTFNKIINFTLAERAAKKRSGVATDHSQSQLN